MEPKILSKQVIRLEEYEVFAFGDVESNEEFSIFYYSEEVNRNKFVTRNRADVTDEEVAKLEEYKYRGHITVKGVYQPLFVKDFIYPLHSVRVIRKTDLLIEEIVAPISFQLKGSNNKLCFGVEFRKYKSMESLINKDILNYSYRKAYQLVFPSDL